MEFAEAIQSLNEEIGTAEATLGPGASQAFFTFEDELELELTALTGIVWLMRVRLGKLPDSQMESPLAWQALLERSGERLGSEEAWLAWDPQEAELSLFQQVDGTSLHRTQWLLILQSFLDSAESWLLTMKELGEAPQPLPSTHAFFAIR